MPLVNAKCTNCGANIKIDDNKEAAVCEFCGSAFIVEKAINNYNITNNINANVVNIYNQSSCNTNPDYIIESGKLLKIPTCIRCVKTKCLSQIALCI